MCGAAAVVQVRQEPRYGLSPRVRGSRLRHGIGQPRMRSIPTCAGQPAIPRPCPCLYAVYPHVCGAAIQIDMSGLLAAGLSPRVRGSHTSLAVHAHALGSIPTCAGQPRSLTCCSVMPRVYPHVCGAAEVVCKGVYPHVCGAAPRRIDVRNTYVSVWGIL